MLIKRKVKKVPSKEIFEYHPAERHPMRLPKKQFMNYFNYVAEQRGIYGVGTTIGDYKHTIAMVEKMFNHTIAESLATTPLAATKGRKVEVLNLANLLAVVYNDAKVEIRIGEIKYRTGEFRVEETYTVVNQALGGRGLGICEMLGRHIEMCDHDIDTICKLVDVYMCIWVEMLQRGYLVDFGSDFLNYHLEAVDNTEVPKMTMVPRASKFARNIHQRVSLKP